MNERLKDKNKKLGFLVAPRAIFSLVHIMIVINVVFISIGIENVLLSTPSQLEKLATNEPAVVPLCWFCSVDIFFVFHAPAKRWWRDVIPLYLWLSRIFFLFFFFCAAVWYTLSPIGVEIPATLVGSGVQNKSSITITNNRNHYEAKSRPFNWF